MSEPDLRCPICAGQPAPFAVVDFNRSCEERRGKFLPKSNEAIVYERCPECGFCFAPDMYRWPLTIFAEKVYNDAYPDIDPDYLTERPNANAMALLEYFPDFVPKGRHLDYGGGNGALSGILRQAGWNTTSYDPFTNPDTDPRTLGSFDLVTAFEVFEHVPDIAHMLETMSDVLRASGLIVFTTLLSDGEIHPGKSLDWWYAAPRNGHISLYSHTSLSLLAALYGYSFGSISPNTHVFARTPHPAWADHPTTRRLLTPV